MTKVVGVRDIARNSNILDGYDYVEVKDKKTQDYKGLFISSKYAKEIKAYLENKIAKQKEEKLNRIMKYAGTMEIEDRYEGLDKKELMAEVAKAKSGL